MTGGGEVQGQPPRRITPFGGTRIAASVPEFPLDPVEVDLIVRDALFEDRAFEDINVKLRDSFRVAGVVKVVDAGLEVHFQTFDPTLAPQPVRLKAGGGVRVLLVKISRSFEATRTDFNRVEPFDEAAVPVK